MLKDTLNLCKKILQALNVMNNRGETIAPFIEALPEEARSIIPDEIAKDPAFANFKDIGEVLAAAKTGSKPWFENLPDDIKADGNISKYKTAEEFARGHQNVVKLVGQKGVIIPKDDAPQEEKDRFLNTLGRPEKPEGYKLEPIEKLHESIKITPESTKAFAEAAHKIGLTNAQANGLNKWYLEEVSAAIARKEEADTKALEAAETALRQKWGGEYDPNLNMAKRFIAKFGPKGAVDAFDGTNPLVIETLANAAKRMSEDSIEKFGASDLSANEGQIKKDIKDLTDKIMATDPSHADYQKMLDTRTKLYEMLNEKE